MFNIKDVKQGLVVANFLRNTGRWFHAIKLCREFLFLLYTLEEEEQLDESLENIVDDMCIWAAPYILSPEIRQSVAYSKAATVCYHQCQYRTARELIEKAIAMDKKIGDKGREANGHGNVGVLFQCVGQFYEAIKHHEKALAIRIKIGDRNGAVTDIGNIGSAFHSVGKYGKAKEYFEKALAIAKEVNDKKGEARLCGNLGGVFCALGEYEKAETYLKKALAIREEIGYQDGEAMDYVGLGTVFLYLSEYVKAKKYIEKALAISMEIGDKKGVALSYENLGAVFLLFGDYAQAKIHLEKALDILIEIGDRHGEAHSYGSLGALFETICEYDKAKAYLQKALAVQKEIDDRRGEAMSLTNLGKTFCSTAEYTKAKQYYEKALMISMEIGDRAREALCYGDLGAVFQSLGEYVKAKEHFEKSLTVSKEIGNRLCEAADYGNLGALFLSLGKYIKAQEYQEKSLAVSKKIGDRKGEAETYCNLGAMFDSLGESVQAKEYLEKSLTIRVEIGDRAGVANVYVNLGVVFQSFGEINRAKECYEMALEIAKEIGDKKGEAASNDNLGAIFLIFGELAKARTYYEKSLAICKDIGDKAGEATSYGGLGIVCRLHGEYVMAEKYLKKALSVAKLVGDNELELTLYCSLALVKLFQKMFQEAFYYLFQSITKCEDLRHSLATNDQLSISFSDMYKHVFPYRLLSELFCAAGNSREALYVVELGRARALADLMATQYSVKMEIPANPESWVGMANIMKKESNCSCLYISYNNQHVSFWILKTSGVFHFRRHRNQNLDEFLSKSFRNFGILSEKECEDRSIKDIQLNSKSSQKESPALRLVEDDNEESQEPEPSLSLYYKMLIAPVTDFLEGREIIIVPDRSLCRVPFAALHDGSGKYLSETFWIRMVPSLTTLKLIQDSPADYHSQTGALIVGDPNVGQVLSVKGILQNISRLPCARKEAEMIGRLLGVQPLLAEHATKEAVLQRINSVGLIHFAAHGNAERGEIALTPQGTSSGFPEEEDYLLTMLDISQVQLRAKLVVLSCCHSGNGQIRTEGVVGIARAFLGSGARSVLVTLWAIEDIATEQFMRLFYEHLVRGESASECLHEAMKWMRGNGYSDTTQWAPFMLIGDNVTLKF